MFDDDFIATSKLEVLIDWHERRAKVKRLNADQESDPISRATLLGNADTHDVAAAVVRRVLEGKSLEDRAESDCPHANVYKDDFLGEWHCDDCGATFDAAPAPADGSDQ